MTGSSAFMAIGQFFFCQILFFSFHANKPFVYGATLMETTKSHAPPSTCSGPERGLRIAHQYGPCSPFSQTKSSPTSSQMLLQDELRVQGFRSTMYDRRTSVGRRARQHFWGHSVGAGNYIVTVGFGTPTKNFNLILDTGSYITWVKNSLYDPSASSTSLNAPCWPSCHYNQSYVDESFSFGLFVVDKIIIQPSDVIPNFVFLRASKDSEGFGEAAGILGLGQGSNSIDDRYGNYSLISQTATTFEKVFCHCLPTKENSTGYLYFGKEALEKCQNSGSYTPLLSNPSDPSPYYVNLIGITIGQKRLKISSAVSSTSSSSSPSTIIDTGTVITRLPRSVYSALRSEFEKWMSDYPRARRDKILDTCYDLRHYDNVAMPNMVLHFENLDVNLDQTAVTWKGKDRSQVCLAFAGNRNENDLTIIGNHQQQKLNIFYNVQDRRIKIGPGNC
ncbi:aspartyl protease family protein At5g10770-like [Durio zibethinus]|uniref:Aspartyl protease family protein At5g10770-like n=1 Tax=Durio zibethinus TaxID=66656 RepID=A0A6P5ZHJ1_DURZI|nr:aspartyl protease family protein At5g10770-like [Durio zibethinus]